MEMTEPEGTREYFVAVGGASQRPFSREQLVRKVDLREVSRDTMVWFAGLDQWQPLVQALPDLADRFNAKTAPPPPPPLGVHDVAPTKSAPGQSSPSPARAPLEQPHTSEPVEREPKADNPWQSYSPLRKAIIIVLGVPVALGSVAVALGMGLNILKGVGASLAGLGGIDVEATGASLVRQNVRSPASFQLVSSDVVWTGVYEKKKPAYIVKVVYDAQNGFGAVLRGCAMAAFHTTDDGSVRWHRGVGVDSSCSEPDSFAPVGGEAKYIEMLAKFNDFTEE